MLLCFDYCCNWSICIASGCGYLWFWWPMMWWEWWYLALALGARLWAVAASCLFQLSWIWDLRCVQRPGGRKRREPGPDRVVKTARYWRARNSRVEYYRQFLRMLPSPRGLSWKCLSAVWLLGPAPGSLQPDCVCKCRNCLRCVVCICVSKDLCVNFWLQNEIRISRVFTMKTRPLGNCS